MYDVWTKEKSLISAGKFADINYITVLTPEEFLKYDGNEVNFQMTDK